MAIVFISPKQKQRVFLAGIAGVFLLLVIIFSLVIFFSKPKEVLPEFAFNKPKLNVNLDLLDSTEFINLEPFTELETQFSYTAKTAQKKEIQGQIAAPTIEEASKMLKDMGLEVLEIKEVEIGRDNPFTPYYHIVVEPVPTKK